MAGLVLQSRFAGLLVEDEDFSSSSDNQKKKNKNNSAKKVEPSKKVKPVPTKTQVPKKKKPKQPAPSEKQWEQWKQRDEQLVDGNFEEELQQAILLSKLDYEEKKDVYQQLKKEADVSKKTEAAAKATSNKNQSTCLEKLLKEMRDSLKDIWTNELVLEATRAAAASLDVPEGVSVLPQGIGSLEPHMRIAPIIQDISWKLDGLN